MSEQIGRQMGTHFSLLSIILVITTLLLVVWVYEQSQRVINELKQPCTEQTK